MSFNPICGVRKNAVERKAFNERRDIFFPECCKKGKWTIIITVKWIVPYSVNTDYIVKVAKKAQIYNSGWIKILHESRFYSGNNYQHSLWFGIYIKVFYNSGGNKFSRQKYTLHKYAKGGINKSEPYVCETECDKNITWDTI